MICMNELSSLKMIQMTMTGNTRRLSCFYCSDQTGCARTRPSDHMWCRGVWKSAVCSRVNQAENDRKFYMKATVVPKNILPSICCTVEKGVSIAIAEDLTIPLGDEGQVNWLGGSWFIREKISSWSYYMGRYGTDMPWVNWQEIALWIRNHVHSGQCHPIIWPGGLWENLKKHCRCLSIQLGSKCQCTEKKIPNDDQWSTLSEATMTFLTVHTINPSPNLQLIMIVK